MYTNNGKGNAELANLPRKLNIALSPSRDDFPHTHINDVGLVAVKHPDTGEVTHPSLLAAHCGRSFQQRVPHDGSADAVAASGISSSSDGVCLLDTGSKTGAVSACLAAAAIDHGACHPGLQK